MKFNKKELEIIKKAVKEYEDRHWDSEGQGWQKTINNLIDKLS